MRTMTKPIQPGLHRVLGETGDGIFTYIGEVVRRKDGWQGYTYRHPSRGHEWTHGPTGGSRLTLTGVFTTGGHRYMKEAVAQVVELRHTMIENHVY